MQLYQSHKQVRAVPITRIDTSTDTAFYRDGANAEQQYSAPSLFARGAPEPGDYLVFYDADAWQDGYVSHSPKAVFEAGYLAISG